MILWDTKEMKGNPLAFLGGKLRLVFELLLLNLLGHLVLYTITCGSINKQNKTLHQTYATVAIKYKIVLLSLQVTRERQIH